MEATPGQAADAAGVRAEELARRRAELMAGSGSTAADVLAATRSAEWSLRRALAAHARSGLAHERAAVAHDRAALALEKQALRSPEPTRSMLLNDAAAHRRAATADRVAAEEDRNQSLGQDSPEAT